MVWCHYSLTWQIRTLTDPFMKHSLLIIQFSMCLSVSHNISINAAANPYTGRRQEAMLNRPKMFFILQIGNAISHACLPTPRCSWKLRRASTRAEVSASVRFLNMASLGQCWRWKSRASDVIRNSDSLNKFLDIMSLRDVIQNPSTSW